MAPLACKRDWFRPFRLNQNGPWKARACLVCFVSLWLALDCFGLLGLALACFGLLWAAVVCFGLLWLALVCFGLLGTLRPDPLIKTDPGRLGPAWFALYRFGLLWIALACLGSLWLALACFGLLWSALACFGLLWCALACLELFGPTPRKKARFGGSPGDLNEQAEVRKQTLPKTLKSSRQLPKST